MACLIIAGLFLSISFHFVQAFAFKLNFYPHNTFLLPSPWVFRDFYDNYAATVGLNPYSRHATHPPFAYLVMLPFTIYERDLALAIMLAGFTLFLWKYVYGTVSGIEAEGRYLKTRRYLKTIVLTFMTYPFLFACNRANTEIWVFMFLALFIHYYQKKEDRKSIFCLACATSMKMYPGALLILFLADKKYKNIFYTLLSVAGLTLLGALVLKGGVMASYSGFVKNMAGLRLDYFLTDGGLQHNLSLFGALRIFYGYFMPGTAFPEFAYSIAMVSLFAVVSLYVVFVEKEFWRAVTAIVMYFLLAPQISYDYKLLQLFIPITLFLGREGKTGSSGFFATAFALLCVPKDYGIIRGDISVAVIINPLIILAVLSVLIYQGCRKNKFVFKGLRGGV